MGYQFLVAMLKEKKKHLQHAIQYIEAGCDNPKLIILVAKEIKHLDKRIKEVEAL